ncbi:MAG: TRAP transporter small permease [Rhodospirillales bacterium]|jgi:TRAP-type C4-dicarboxylate transport system permease small subunit
MEQRDERSFLRRVLDFPVEDVLGVAALLAAFVVMSIQIFLRYVLNDSLIWSEEAARYLLIAIAFLGCATGCRKACHIRIDVIDLVLPPRSRRTLSLAVDAIVLFYVAYVAWLAIEIIPILGRQPSTAMRMPMWIAYGVIALGFALAALRIVLARLPGARRD